MLVQHRTGTRVNLGDGDRLAIVAAVGKRRVGGGLSSGEIEPVPRVMTGTSSMLSLAGSMPSFLTSEMILLLPTASATWM